MTCTFCGKQATHEIRKAPCCERCWQKLQHVLEDEEDDLLKEHEPKTGKWILDDDDANSWECSECGGLLMINDGTPHENDWHFCPYCGAKLDKQEMKWE